MCAGWEWVVWAGMVFGFLMYGAGYGHERERRHEG
jgi:hypothetical protein